MRRRWISSAAPASAGALNLYGLGTLYGGMRETERLSIDQLEDLMFAIHENANNLTVDARILIEKHRFARAYAVAELAAEELGKLLIVGGVAVQVAAKQPVSWRRFWRRC